MKKTNWTPPSLFRTKSTIPDLSRAGFSMPDHLDRKSSLTELVTCHGVQTLRCCISRLP